MNFNVVKKYKILIFIVSFAFFIFFYSYLTDNHKYLYTFSKEIDSNELLMPTDTKKDVINYNKVTEKGTKTNLKYILQWTSSKTLPFSHMGVGQKGFIERNCPYTNCYVTGDRNLLGNYTNFDVIAFASPELVHYNKDKLPQKRSPHQKFVFGSIESAANYPICLEVFDGFFNWTWTYKLDSDSRWGYIVVRNIEGKVIGPNKTMHWIKPEEMLPVSDELKNILSKKKKTAAWFVSNCFSINKRRDFAKSLNNILQSKYNLSIDIYGRCGNLKCPRNDDMACDEMIRNDYFFYLAFENSFSEDYVTEKLLHAVEFNAIPIVFGGANYSRFLPEESYLNARELGVEKLAAKIYDLLNDFDRYVEYFKWTNHYKYHRRKVSIETNDYCAMCAMLNDESKVKQISIYKDFRTWWNGYDQTSCKSENI